MGWQEVIIEEVRRFPCIYNARDPGYRDVIRKQNVWILISQATGLNVDDCRKKWTQLRDRYRKWVNHWAKLPSGSAYPISAKNQKWKYFEIMSFLEPYLADLPTFSMGVKDPHLAEATPQEATIPEDEDDHYDDDDDPECCILPSNNVYGRNANSVLNHSYTRISSLDQPSGSQQLSMRVPGQPSGSQLSGKVPSQPSSSQLSGRLSNQPSGSQLPGRQPSQHTPLVYSQTPRNTENGRKKRKDVVEEAISSALNKSEEPLDLLAASFAGFVKKTNCPEIENWAIIELTNLIRNVREKNKEN